MSLHRNQLRRRRGNDAQRTNLDMGILRRPMGYKVPVVRHMEEEMTDRPTPASDETVEMIFARWNMLGNQQLIDAVKEYTAAAVQAESRKLLTDLDAALTLRKSENDDLGLREYPYRVYREIQSRLAALLDSEQQKLGGKDA